MKGCPWCPPVPSGIAKSGGKVGGGRAALHNLSLYYMILTYLEKQGTLGTLGLSIEMIEFFDGL